MDASLLDAITTNVNRLTPDQKSNRFTPMADVPIYLAEYFVKQSAVV